MRVIFVLFHKDIQMYLDNDRWERGKRTSSWQMQSMNSFLFNWETMLIRTGSCAHYGKLQSDTHMFRIEYNLYITSFRCVLQAIDNGATHIFKLIIFFLALDLRLPE